MVKSHVGLIYVGSDVSIWLFHNRIKVVLVGVLPEVDRTQLVVIAQSSETLVVKSCQRGCIFTSTTHLRSFDEVAVQNYFVQLLFGV